MKLKTGNQQRKIKKLKLSLLKRSMNLVNLQPGYEKKRTQINQIRDEREDIKTDPMGNKVITKGLYKQLYIHRFDNL